MRKGTIKAVVPRRRPLAMSRAACPFADDIAGHRACAARFIELHPSGITCLHCPSRRTPAADAAAHLRVIREQPFVSNEQRAAIDRVLERA
jgi:hypothetical protein